MSYPSFPNVEQLLSVLMGELPQGVYADDRADSQDVTKRSYSSSELRAQATMIANLYTNLEDIWQNKWISTVNPDALNNWENELFSAPQDGSLPFAVRQGNLLAQRRARGSISTSAIESIISGVLGPVGLTFALLPYSGQLVNGLYSSWILAYSQLGLDSYLGIEDPLYGTGLNPGQTPLDCNLNYAAAGLTAQDLANIQLTAYGYEVDIYGNASAQTLAILDKLLTQHEPARSEHFIVNNATPPDLLDPSDYLDGGPPGSMTLVDSIDFGLGLVPAATYDIYDFAI